MKVKKIKKAKKVSKKIAKKAKKPEARKPVESAESRIVLPKVSSGRTPQVLRGFKDVLPTEQKYWDYIRDKVRRLAADYGFERIDLPIVEETGLFVRSVGRETDIVSKEMFTFIDRGEENVSLRPEATASIARAYINHGMLNQPQPVKLFYFGPMFRYERPQSGRYRQFTQFGFEALGDTNPVLDAQIIAMSHGLFLDLGMETSVQINSIGCFACRKEYMVQLVNYYKSQKSSLCEDCKIRLAKNPMRLLDCKEEKCRSIGEDAPKIIDWLCDGCKNHFVKVLEFLDELAIPYNLDSRLVRGLDYYTKTVFEIIPLEKNIDAANPGEKKAASALCGGGRYDGLVEMMGGRPTPAVGVATGVERLILKIKELNLAVPEKEKPDVFIAQLGEPAKRKCLALFENLRREGVKVAENFSKDGLKNQLDFANRTGAKYALILGQKEISEETILLRDMEGGSQETINFNKAVKEIKKRLAII